MEQTNKENNSSFTVLRIKRKRTEESPDTLVVNDNENRNKKIKRENHQNKVFKLADSFDLQTFNEKENSSKLKEHLTQINLNNGELKEKTKLINNRNKESKVPRYKVITKNRALNKEDTSKEESYELYDVVKEDSIEGLLQSNKDDELMCNFNAMVKEYLNVNENTEVQDYVYDLYIQVNPSKNENNENAASLIWEEIDNEIYDNNEDESEIDSEDSNAEDYYQNDYPSTEDEDDNSGIYTSSYEDSDDSYSDENFRGSNYYNYNNHRNINFEYSKEDYDDDYY